MLHKCANPACKAPFRSLREGKLFLAENHVSERGDRKPRREHFWLCAPCSAQYTLRFDEKSGMVTVPLQHPDQLRYATGAA
jgi:hypothetical protein